MTAPDSDYLRKEITDLLEAARLYRSCISCCHFEEGTEGCGLAGGARPPARTIAMGCPKYSQTPPF